MVYALVSKTNECNAHEGSIPSPGTKFYQLFTASQKTGKLIKDMTGEGIGGNLDSFKEHDEMQAPPEPVVVPDMTEAPIIHEAPDILDTSTNIFNATENKPANRPIEAFDNEIVGLAQKAVERDPQGIPRIKPEVAIGVDYVTLENARAKLETASQSDPNNPYLKIALDVNTSEKARLLSDLGKTFKTDSSAGINFALAAKTTRDVVSAGNTISEFRAYFDQKVIGVIRNLPTQRLI